LQALSAGLAALVLLADALPTGWQAAAAAGSAEDASQLWLPLALDALVRGARACSA